VVLRSNAVVPLQSTKEMHMVEETKQVCPECGETSQPEPGLDRRRFMTVVGGSAAALAVGGTALPQVASADGRVNAVVAARSPRPAEDLVRELYAGLTANQRSQVVYPWNHGQTGSQLPSRLRFYNQAFGRQIGQVYTAPQRELVQRILRAISSDDEGYDRFATVLRTDNWNNSGFNGAAATIFGKPALGRFAWLFTAHHLTLRCEGDSNPNAAFGGPMYYGHLVDGYSQRNVWNFQTREVQHVYEALSSAQRDRAVLTGSPGENYESVRFRSANATRPGLSFTELSRSQRYQVCGAMRKLLSPYRKEDADEVITLLQRNGGLDRMHLAFYRDRGATDNSRWHFWRLEGPGFVWNYRILPHVHCFVNVGAQT
jgi:hypothetical protein